MACAIILPTGLEYNKPVAGKRYRAIGKAMQVPGIDNMTDEEAADATIAAVKQLSADVGIPADLHGILKEEDVAFLAKSAYADAAAPAIPATPTRRKLRSCTRACCKARTARGENDGLLQSKSEVAPASRHSHRKAAPRASARCCT